MSGGVKCGLKSSLAIYGKQENISASTIGTASRLLAENLPYPTLVTLWRKDEPLSQQLSLYHEESERQFERIRRIIDEIPDSSKLAVYGAGGHTARLLGMTRLGTKNIVKFYDSDPQKSGLSMIGKNIQQLNKDDILRGEVELILISSFASERSIERFIRSVGANVKIIKLYS